MTQVAANGTQPGLPEPLVALLTEQLGVTVERERLTAAMTFQELGVSSLALMEMVVAAEEQFGVVLPEEAMELSPSHTLGEAARLFAYAG
ncbi:MULTISPECIES: acyl carrier protein [unclassified Streptomyces]|uniref:acyl carrier protein n=1 Tax=unclassified Streptomyces TaxID=2593676 RepID=UPI0033FEEEAE